MLSLDIIHLFLFHSMCHVSHFAPAEMKDRELFLTAGAGQLRKTPCSWAQGCLLFASFYISVTALTMLHTDRINWTMLRRVSWLLLQLFHSRGPEHASFQKAGWGRSLRWCSVLPACHVNSNCLTELVFIAFCLCELQAWREPDICPANADFSFTRSSRR